jgi:hypothetical protein
MATVTKRDRSVSWRKSSYSGNTGGSNCVEIGFTSDAVSVRDSKNSDGTTLAFNNDDWQRFLDSLS